MFDTIFRNEIVCHKNFYLIFTHKNCVKKRTRPEHSLIIVSTTKMKVFWKRKSLNKIKNVFLVVFLDIYCL